VNMFGSIKKMWADTGVTTAIDGVIRLAAKGNALEIQRWYFRLKKDAYSISLRDGISPPQVEQRALDSIDPEKARLFNEIVERLSQPGGALEEINEYLKHNKPI